MALFKIFKNINANNRLPQSYHEGYCYFDIATNKFWIDTSNAAAGRKPLNALRTNVADTAKSIIFGTCSTAASTATKVVIIDPPQDKINNSTEILESNFPFNSLETGVMLAVWFQNGNTAATPKLRCRLSTNNTITTTAANIYCNSSTPANGTEYKSWAAGSLVIFTYMSNINAWVMADWHDPGSFLTEWFGTNWANIGANNNYIYLNSNGMPVASTETLGDDVTPIYLDNGVFTASTNTFKVAQEYVNDPTADSDSTTFIDTIEQDENGEIYVTKANLDTSGIWTGTASALTDFDSNDAADSTSDWRSIWMNNSDSTIGRPTLDNRLAFQTSTGRLKTRLLEITGSAGSTNTISSDATNNIFATVGGVTSLVVTSTSVRPSLANSGKIDLGTSNGKWDTIYGNSLQAIQTLTAITDGKGDQGSGVSPRYLPYQWYCSLNRDPEDGEIFVIKMPSAGNTSGVWLSINGNTTAKYHPIVASNTTGRLTTHFAAGTTLLIAYEENMTATAYALAGADATASVTGIWRILNYYDSNTNTLVRTYKATNSVDLPLLLRNSAASQTAAAANISTYADSYAAIANAHVPVVNPSTGVLKVRNTLQVDLQEWTPAAGANLNAFTVMYKSTDGSLSRTVHPIGILGNDATNADNSGVRLGSNNGTTVVGAGESSANFASARALYNNENLYLVSDGDVLIYKNVANAGTGGQGPLKAAGFGGTITTNTFVVANGTVGDLKTTNTTVALYNAINAGTALTSSTIATGDYIAIADVSGTVSAKITLTNLKNWLKATGEVGGQIKTGTTAQSSNSISVTCDFVPKGIAAVCTDPYFYPSDYTAFGVISTSSTTASVYSLNNGTLHATTQNVSTSINNKTITISASRLSSASGGGSNWAYVVWG